MGSRETKPVVASREPLFRPFTVKSLTLRNRIVMSPMGQGHAKGGIPDPNYPAYYRRRAEGEVGLIISGATAVPHPSAHMDLNEPHFHGDEPLAGWKRAIDEVHAAGGKMIPQLWHSGLHGLAHVPPTWDLHGPSGVWFPGPQADGSAGPSELRGEPMTQAEIEAIVEAFGRAAETARCLGFDGVEVHAGHGFLIDQFFWDRTNLRTDCYGGTLRDRTRFAVEILQEIRRRVGPEFPIFMRISQFKMMDYTARLADTPQHLAEFLEPLADAGVDLFDCSLRRFQQPAFDGSRLNLAGWVKKLTGKPTLCCGGVGLGAGSVDFGDPDAYNATASASLSELDSLCEMLERGDFDLVSLARAILGDAAWPAKVRQGREHELKPFTADLMMSLS
ncbi:MAG: NADH:flavin oxidoreductase [Rhodospirillales bacterium]|nr:NADH:flavin oxidoreductase [Rhodospirillales bacterium]